MMYLILFFLFCLRISQETPMASGQHRGTKEIKEAARLMLQGYVSSKSRVSELQEVYHNAKLLFGEFFSDQEIEETMLRAIALTFKQQNKEQSINHAMCEVTDRAWVDMTSPYADKHVRGMIETIADPDCMSREFNVRDEFYDSGEARKVFKKCKLLVLRNVFATDFLNEFRRNFTEFMAGLQTGRVSKEGTTTNGDLYFLQSIDHKRWEIALPESLAHDVLLVNKDVMDVLMDEAILGPSLALHSLGAAIAENGANAQRWHFDEDYLFSRSSWKTSGIAGHDLPSYAVTMMVPLLNMTFKHGPTEFCMGSSHLTGILEPNVMDESLTSETSDYAQYKKFQDSGACAPRFWRSPQLKFGDMLLFDYQLEHRGGQNISPDLRSVLYTTYSRYWYKDSNFVVEKDGDEKEKDKQNDDSEGYFEQFEKQAMLRKILKSARLAIPDKLSPCNSEDCRSFMESFNLEGMNNLFPDVESSRDVLRSSTSAKFKFLISNVDVADENLHVEVDGTKVGSCQVGDTLMISARVGEVVQVRTRSGFVYKAWKVVPDQQQLVLSKSTINVP